MNHILWMTLLEFFFMRDYYYYRQKLHTHYQHKSNSNACCCFSICVNDWGKKSVTVFLEEGGGRGGSLCNVMGGHRNTIKYWPVMVCYDLKKNRPAMEIPLHLKLTTPGYHFARVVFVVFVVMDDLMFFPLWCKNYCTLIFFLSFYEQYCKNPQ